MESIDQHPQDPQIEAGINPASAPQDGTDLYDRFRSEEPGFLDRVAFAAAIPVLAATVVVGMARADEFYGTDCGGPKHYRR